MGIGLVVLIGTGKMFWSIQNAGESGKSILVPAILGLLICCVLIYYGIKELEKNKFSNSEIWFILKVDKEIIFKNI